MDNCSTNDDDGRVEVWRGGSCCPTPTIIRIWLFLPAFILEIVYLSKQYYSSIIMSHNCNDIFHNLMALSGHAQNYESTNPEDPWRIYASGRHPYR